MTEVSSVQSALTYRTSSVFVDCLYISSVSALLLIFDGKEAACIFFYFFSEKICEKNGTYCVVGKKTATGLGSDDFET